MTKNERPLAVITGASQGIGEAIAKIFASELKADIALLARNERKLDSVAADCRDLGGNPRKFVCDITKPTDVVRVGKQILHTLGTPSILVNNAGAFTPGSILETDSASFRYQVDVNLTGAFDVTKAFLKSMMDEGKGHIFYMASVASIKAYAGGAAYCAAKHGLLGLARVVREESKEHGVRVTSILPGATRTPSWDGVEEPEERFMPAEDIAKSILEIYLLSDRTVVEEIILRPQLGDL